MSGFLIGVWVTLVCIVLIAEFQNYREDHARE